MLCGQQEALEALLARTARPQPRPPFAPVVLDLLDRVAKRLLHEAEAKAYPDVVTFGFFCRRANLGKLAERYAAASAVRLGRGLSFHIAPSNVPINFAYTLVHGLLAGNVCVVKASSKAFAQTHLVAAAFAEALAAPECAALHGSVFVVEYGRERQDLTEAFSRICDVRVVWGGDATIAAVRKAALPPRAYDVTFADRYSLAAFSAEAVCALAGDAARLRRLAQAFYNDTYLYDQNACSSPRLIVWLGERRAAQRAQEVFWTAVLRELRDRYPVEPVVMTNKLMAACRTAVAVPGARLVLGTDNRVMRVSLPELTPTLPDLRSAGGLYHEYVAASLDALAGIIDEKYQTLSYFGLDAEALRSFVIDHGLTGIDRIVPAGRTAEMGLVWDGYDLIETLSRVVTVS